MSINRGMCLEEDMQNIFYKEEWKEAGTGIKYRRVGTDVEIKIANWENLVLTAWTPLEKGQLPAGYRPDTDLSFLVLAKNKDTGALMAVELQVKSYDGKLMFQNIRSNWYYSCDTWFCEIFNIIRKERLIMKKKILIVLATILIILVAFSQMYLSQETTNVIETVQNLVINEIEAEDNRSVLEQKENASTTEIQSLSEEEEIQLEGQTVENEAFELQGNIAYEGDRAKHWNVELGDYAGLTYYSQVDARWNNHIYTSTNNNSQTIGSSGCGPTSASMIVSSIKGTITPDTLRRHIC